MRCYKCSYNSICGDSDFFMDCTTYFPVPVCECGCTMQEISIGKNIDTNKQVILFSCVICYKEVEIEV